MLWSVVAPELLVGLAVSQFFAARYGESIMKDYQWESIHVWLANMGHFILHFDESIDRPVQSNCERVAVGETLQFAEGYFEDSLRGLNQVSRSDTTPIHELGKVPQPVVIVEESLHNQETHLLTGSQDKRQLSKAICTEPCPTLAGRRDELNDIL